MHLMTLRSALLRFASFPLVFAGALGALQLQSIQAQSTTPPTEAQLLAWEKRLTPGQYQVDEYLVDVQGEPMEASRKVSDKCLSAADLASFLRGPALVPKAWSCGGETFEVSLTDRLFRNVMVCSGGGDKPVMGIMDASIGPDKKVALASYIRAEFSGGGQRPKLVQGQGGRLIYMGECLVARVDKDIKDIKDTKDIKATKATKDASAAKDGMAASATAAVPAPSTSTPASLKPAPSK